MSFLEPTFFFVLALSLLVLVHEWGHFWVARRNGVRVLRFAIGFGPEIVGRTRGDTRWSICAIPFGGYVKFAGDNPEEEREEAADEFLSQSLGVRSAIVLAGPAMNYILAILLYGAVLWTEGVRVYPEPRVGSVVEETLAESMGVQPDDRFVSMNGNAVENWADVDRELSGIEAGQSFDIRVDRGGEIVTLSGAAPAEGFGETFFGISFFVEPVVGDVMRRSPAWKAGLRSGDLIVQMDGEPIDRWSALQETISERPGEEIAFAYERGGELVHATVVPESELVPSVDGEEAVGRIGILQRIEREPIGPLAALAGGWNQTWRLTRHVVELIPRLPGMIFNALFRGQDDGGIGGPVRMAQLFGEAARWGVLSFVTLLAFISTQLAVFNLLPIPVLDGGHMALYTVEFITRRPPSLRVRIILQQVGLAILLLLMLSVTFMDVGRMFG